VADLELLYALRKLLRGITGTSRKVLSIGERKKKHATRGKEKRKLLGMRLK